MHTKMDALRWDRMEGYPGERNVDGRRGGGRVQRQSSATEKSRGGGAARSGGRPYWFWSCSTPARCLATMLTTLRHSCAQAGRWEFNLGSGGGARVSRCIFRLSRLFTFDLAFVERRLRRQRAGRKVPCSGSLLLQIIRLSFTTSTKVSCKSCPPLLFLNKHLPVKRWHRTQT